MIQLMRGIPSFLYIIHIHLWNSSHTSVIFHNTQDCGNTTANKLLLPPTNSSICIEHLIQVTPVTWELNLWVGKHPSLRSLRTIRTRMWPRSPGWQQQRSTKRKDTSNIRTIYASWQMRPQWV